MNIGQSVDSEMDSKALAPICAIVLILLIARTSRRRRNIYWRNKQIWMRPSLRRRFLPGHDIQRKMLDTRMVLADGEGWRGWGQYYDRYES